MARPRTLTYPPFLASEFPEVPIERARFAVLPVPLEKSVSYGKGTYAGPSAILEASQQLEALLDDMVPGEGGITTLPPLPCAGTIESALVGIEENVARILANKCIPVVLGGEHTVTYGVLRAYTKSARARPGIIQFDAHADLRDRYESSFFSHACVMRRAVADLGLRLVQFGVRELSSEEKEARERYGVVAHDCLELQDLGIPEPILPPDFPRDVYISFDVDGFDASLMPATGTPSPGGLFWHDARRLIARIAKVRRIVGFDVVELAPRPGLHACDFTAAKLTALLMCFASRSMSVTQN
ncbi:MAG: agmatinase [Desulfovibrionaceae bacterium]|nr:agmatinase [Desulfovibrionaceae bacterium]